MYADMFFSLYNIPSPFTNNGVTVTNNGDGTLSITGSAATSARWIVPNISSIDGGVTAETRLPGIKWLSNGTYLFAHEAGSPVRIGLIRYSNIGSTSGASGKTTNANFGRMEETIDNEYLYNTVGLYVPANADPTCTLTPSITVRRNGYVISDSLAEDIASAIKTKTGLTSVKGSDMPDAILSISGGGGTLIQKTVTANGTYNASDDSADGYSKVTVNVPASAVDTGTKNINSNGTHDVIGYASASVNVPNSYAAGDEGKVVQSGALVSQTSQTITENGTYDTTTKNSVTVNVQGGASITDGTEVLTRNASGYPTTAKHYGTKVYPKAYWNRIATDGPWVALTSITFADTVTEIMNAAFAYCAALTSIDVSTVVKLENNAFSNCTSLTSLSFPVLTTIGQSVFLSCSGLTSLSMPLCTVIQGSAIRGCSGLQTAQLGSVGHAVTTVGSNSFQGCTQSGLTITVYTTGDRVDSLLTNIRASATAATVVFKASESTTYNGNSYAADATMLTSTV